MDARNIEFAESSGYLESISQVYLFLGRCFSYPERDFYEAMKDAQTKDKLSDIIGGLPFEVKFKGIPSPSLSHEDMAVEHINFFDIGYGSSPPCPLYESAYEREDMNRRDILEELLRFYEHFDIKISDKERDYPDHLVAELELMAFLSQKEADAKDRGKDTAPYRIAQMDFLERHLNAWAYKPDERIKRRMKEPFYREVSAFMVEFVSNHLLYLKTFDKNNIS